MFSYAVSCKGNSLASKIANLTPWLSVHFGKRVIRGCLRGRLVLVYLETVGAVESRVFFALHYPNEVPSDLFFCL